MISSDLHLSSKAELAFGTIYSKQFIVNTILESRIKSVQTIKDYL
jgi:hypothetical protein